MLLDLANPSQAFYDDPYPTYETLRREQPFLRSASGVFLTRYTDVVATYRLAGNIASSDKKIEFLPKFGQTPLFEHHTNSLVFNDAPSHTRVRKLLMGALNQRAISRMDAGVQQLVDGLLDAIVPGQSFDLINDFCAAIPVEVIGNLLGVPTQDRTPLRGWSLAILAALEPSLTPEMHEQGNAAVTDFLAFLRQLVASRRAHPLNPDEDVLTRLIQGETGGEQLSEVELLHNCIFLLNAGHETTTNTLGNGFNAFLNFPDQWQKLASNPSDSALVNSAVEEVLRFESPLQLNNRRLLVDANIGGDKFTAGTSVTLCIGSANRDPTEFMNPNQFDITRKPNRHLAFGHSEHACSGMNVARLEVRIALGKFAARFSTIERAGEPTRDRRVRFRGLKNLPIIATGMTSTR